MHSFRTTFGIGSMLALTLLVVVWLFTNHMTPQWDMHYYLDMAMHGIWRNPNLAAPFAYRPGGPLIAGALAHLLHADTESVFRLCNAVMCAIFILSCFYCAIYFGANVTAACFVAASLALNFNVVKWTLFSGTMVDIYAYPFLLAAFCALCRRQPYLCLAICAVGLFFKEFLLVPLAVQSILLLLEARRKPAAVTWIPLLFSAAVLGTCFVLPRLSIHVARTFQDIDPINDGSTVRRLLTYPLSRRHDFNILFAYLAGWLPVLVLLSRQRARLALDRLRNYRLPVALFLLFHFLLTMYGGTNIDIYITYCAPVQILILVILLRDGNVQMWETAVALLAVFIFNRIWMHVPLPENGLDSYLDFYGGYYMRVNTTSFLRFGEVSGYIAAAGLLRYVVDRWSRPSASARQAVSEIPSGVA